MFLRLFLPKNSNMKVSYLILLITVLWSCGGENNSSNPQTSQASTTQKTYKPTVKTSLSMVFPEMTVKKGEQACMTVTVKDFDKIVSLQHSVSWDTKVLKLEGVSNFKLKSMSKGSFGLTYSDSGSYGVSWYDPNIKGISVADGSPIYDVCFTTIGESGSYSDVRVTSDPVKVEVSNAEERILGIPTGKGRVTIE